MGKSKTETTATVAVPKKSRKPKSDKEAQKAAVERERASKAGLSLVQYRILSAIGSADPREGLTYRQIEKETGYYSILTAQLRASSEFNGTGLRTHESSLGSKGLVRELQQQGDDARTVISFGITAKGKKVLAKALNK